MDTRKLVLLIALSLLQTDWYQSQPILTHTAENPLVSPSGRLVWEKNPNVNGSYEAAEDMVDFMEQAHEVMPWQLGAAFAASRLIAVINNSAIIDRTGLPQCFVIAYRWRF